jgi:hypothetical protein
MLLSDRGISEVATVIDEAVSEYSDKESTSRHLLKCIDSEVVPPSVELNNLAPAKSKTFENGPWLVLQKIESCYVYRLHFSSSQMSCRFQSKEKLPMLKEGLGEAALAPPDSRRHCYASQIEMTDERKILLEYRPTLRHHYSINKNIHICIPEAYSYMKSIRGCNLAVIRLLASSVTVDEKWTWSSIRWETCT